MFTSLRYGHATNSSSAHSVILHSSARFTEDLDDSPFPETNDDASDTFCYSSARGKALYMIHTNEPGPVRNPGDLDHIQALLKDRGVAIDVAQEIRRAEYSEVGGDLRVNCPAGIDHLLWFEMMLDPRVVFHGYDDNSGQPFNRGPRIDFCGMQMDDSITWRQDGNAVVAYNRRNGNKFRWSRSPYLKSVTPELVDIKITDHCPHGCAFCYQGSTPEGLHAPLRRIGDIFDQMAAMGVFELAIGGGEPARHPEFARIIDMATERGLTVNFTAFGIDWLKDSKTLAALSRAKSGGVGISVHSERDIQKVVRARTHLRSLAYSGALRMDRDVIAQTVVGATPGADILRMVDVCASEQIPLLLLGYKTVGRGRDLAPGGAEDDQVLRILERARGNIAQEIERSHGFHLSVDTAFLDRYSHLLDFIGIPLALRSSPEGKFSMYVDAVAGLAGPSSYCEPGLMAPIGDLRAQFAGM